jgi:DNA-directed RNA polymerase beta' subunit
MMAGNKGQIVADPNELYKELFESNKVLKSLTGKVEDLSEERLNLYNAFKGVTGLGDPIQAENQKKGVKGILRHIFGSNPKFSAIQFKLLGASVNLVGRGAITPNPDMDMDHIGIPESKAWESYQPFIIRNLVRSGMSKIAALDAYKNKSKAAREMLLKEMETRPVLVNRYPVLHRYGLMAFMPKLVKGDTIQMTPIVTKAYGADFDGDTCQWHLPVGEKARIEAMDKMLPSKNLFSASNFKALYVPNQEFVQGLHAASASRDEGPSKRTFATRKDALRAYKRGEVNLGTPIDILEDKASRGK